ncbi:hypothetical protein GCM10009096_04440 [Parasphingorhabdus litoris]|uniref:Flagellar protein FliT n=1 Tax=Parasphingorhabdus litoris TaxID=394733 RepID=A0ABN1A3T8_9SPHN|nr:hypothetical protein [Parasphingorhabdus litoris]
MKQIVETFRISQDMLFSALEGHDSDAIFQASQKLGQAAAQLGTIDADDIDQSLQPMISEADELMQASIYRLRFLRDHSSTRLQLLAGFRENQANTYSGSARSR